MSDLPEAPGRKIKDSDVGWASALSSAVTYSLVTYVDRLPEDSALRDYLGSDVIALLTGIIVYVFVFLVSFLRYFIALQRANYIFKRNVRALDGLISMSNCDVRKCFLINVREDMLVKLSKFYDDL